MFDEYVLVLPLIFWNIFNSNIYEWVAWNEMVWKRCFKKTPDSQKPVTWIKLQINWLVTIWVEFFEHAVSYKIFLDL